MGRATTGPPPSARHRGGDWLDAPHRWPAGEPLRNSSTPCPQSVCMFPRPPPECSLLGTLTQRANSGGSADRGADPRVCLLLSKIERHVVVVAVSPVGMWTRRGQPPQPARRQRLPLHTRRGDPVTCLSPTGAARARLRSLARWSAPVRSRPSAPAPACANPSTPPDTKPGASPERSCHPRATGLAALSQPVATLQRLRSHPRPATTDRATAPSRARKGEASSRALGPRSRHNHRRPKHTIPAE